MQSEHTTHGVLLLIRVRAVEAFCNTCPGRRNICPIWI